MCRRRFLPGLIALTLAAAPAFAWKRDSEPPWPNGTVPLQLQLGNTPAYRDGSTPNSTALAALQSWNLAMGRIQFSGVSGSGAPIAGGNGQNNVFFSTTVYGRAFDPGVVGITLIYSSGGRRTECDVIVNQREPWDSYRGNPLPAVPDLRRLLVHEFGHVLGLDHNDTGNDQVPGVMNSTLGSYETPADDELNGAAALYGLGSGFPNPTPLVLNPNSLNDTAVDEGEPVSFNIAFFIQGSAPMVFQWLRDGVVIAGASTGRFSIARTTAADAGVYTAIVTNNAGSASRTATLRVNPPAAPIVSVAADRMSFTRYAGEALELSADFSGAGPVAQVWRRDGVIVAEQSSLPGTRTTSSALVRLDLRVLAPGDAGSYVLTVSNRLGSASSRPIRVIVRPAAAPTFVLHPLGMTFGAGLDTVSGVLDCSVIGPEPIRYQWKKNGEALAGQTMRQLPIAVDSPSVAGIYTVTASNSFGATESQPATVRRAGQTLRIVRQPASERRASSPASIVPSVQAVGTAPLTYQWFKNGVALPFRTDSNLSLPMNVPSDGGSFTVRVTDETGSVTSEPALWELVPTSDPLYVVEHPSSWNASVGDTLFIVARTNLSASVQWYRNGVALPGRTANQLDISPMRAEDAGTYTASFSGDRSSVRSNNCVIALQPGNAPIIRQQPASRGIRAGAVETLLVSAISTSALTYQWRRNGVALTGSSATANSLVIMASDATAGRYSVTVSNAAGSVTSDDAVISLIPGGGAPSFEVQPLAQRAPSGSTVVLSANALGDGVIAYQWAKDGREIPGATTSSLGFSPIDGSDAGTYLVVASNSLGRATSTPALLTVDPAGRLLNLSARALSRGGDDALITGFVVQGAGTKRLLVRAIGPALAQLGVAGAIPDPKLTIFDSAGRSRAAVDNWGDSPNDINSLATTTTRVGGFALPAASRDAAFIAALEPGAYTAHLTSPALAGPRVGLVEIYDTETGAPRLINLSTRARVEAGEGALIAGFVVDAGAPKRVLVRGIGPALAPFGVSDALADPHVEIIRSGETAPVAANDNWGEGDSAALQAAFTRIGAFALPSGSKDAALLTSLAPGAYTVKVTGANNTTGVALVEIYEVP